MTRDRCPYQNGRMTPDIEQNWFFLLLFMSTIVFNQPSVIVDKLAEYLALSKKKTGPTGLGGNKKTRRQSFTRIKLSTRSGS